MLQYFLNAYWIEGVLFDTIDKFSVTISSESWTY